MIDKSRRIKLGRGIYLNIIDTDKFKSNQLSYYIIRPLARKEITYNALIPLVLKRGTVNHPTALDLERALEELYGARLSTGIRKIGEKQVSKFTIHWADEDYVGRKGLDMEVANLLREIIYEPFLENGIFKSKHVEQEKTNLSKIIESQVNDKSSYALQRCISAMCINERFGLSPLGDKDHLKDISNSKLYTHYRDVLETSQIEIFYSGNIKEEVVDHIKEINKVERDSIIEIPDDVIISSVKTKNMVMEKMDINQGKMVIGYRSGIEFKDDLYEALLVGNNIFGGTASSKLFTNVREKESLAYYISSRLYRQKSIILVDAGIEVEDFDKTVDIVRKELASLKEGNFDGEDIEMAKEDLKSSLDTIEDTLGLMTEFRFNQILAGDSRSLDEIRKSYDQVSREEILEAVNTIDMDTIYFLGKEVEK